MKNNLIKLALAGVFGLSALAASAEEAYKGSWYALPGVSVMNTDSDLKAEDNNVGGFLRLGKELSEHWDVQLGLSHNRADEDSRLFTSGKYKQTLLGVDALYMFSREKFRPFLLAGLGVGHNSIDYKAGAVDVDGSKTSWMANVGLGAQYLINDVFGVQADIRHVWSRAEVGNAAFGRDDETIGNTLFNLGAIIRFGAPKPATAAPVAVEPVSVNYVEPSAAPEPDPAPAEPCKPTTETVTIQAEKLFGFDKSTLSGNGKQELDAVAEKINQHTDIEVVLVTGHTDRIGTDAYNQKLSERRANTVKNYLITKGVDANRLQAVGKGESEPVVDCKGIRGKKLIECLAPNRRVVVDATHKQEAGCASE